ncbi:MAG: HAD family hydrolase [Candidatus Thiodiazotropha sp.]|jgi:phosphoglycolate phosphatase-like HAD superfamily hydrolase
MFDIDGTLVESYDLDAKCFSAVIEDELGVSIGVDWTRYKHVTDSGILNQIINELNLAHERERIVLSVKAKFTAQIKDHLSQQKVFAVDGAAEFLAELVERKDVALAFATGGWLETAKMKLDAANIRLPEIPIVSSSDHYSRIEIMKKAQTQAGYSQYTTKTYFGDGPWDLKASLDLGYNFVLVGSRIDYHQSIRNFKETDLALNYIGL